MIFALRFSIITSLLVLVIGIIGTVSTKEVIYLNMIQGGGAVYVLSGTYFLFLTGEFIRSREYRISKLGIALILLGVLFKIMHWPAADVILASGLVTILFCYGIYILKKKPLLWYHGLAFLYLLTLMIDRFGKLMHWPFKEELSFLLIALLSILLTERFRRNK